MDEEKRRKIQTALAKIRDDDLFEACDMMLDGFTDSKIKRTMGITDEKLKQLKTEIQKLLEKEGVINKDERK